MGTDWHPYIEEQVDGAWKPKWQPMPDYDWWYENLVDAKIDDGSAQIMFSQVEESQRHKVLTEYYKSLPWSEIRNTFTGHPLVNHMWYEHVDFQYWKHLATTDNPDPEKTSFGRRWADRLGGRDYSWFNLFGIHGRGRDSPSHDGIPEDTSREVRAAYTRMDSDAHSAQWVMIDHLYANVANEYSQVRWLKKHVDAPERTRLIFWFDN